MWPQLMPALRINLLFTLLVGIAYPLLTTGICQVAFPRQANGSLVTQGGKTIGSELIAQSFTRPEYFQPRPSAAGNGGYDASNSGASNYGATNKKLIDRVQAAVDKFRKENPDYRGPIPADMLAASGSGLDPDISPASAEAQAARVAKARGVPVERVSALVSQYTRQPDLRLLGEPRVNVLAINLALDRNWPARPSPRASAPGFTSVRERD